MPRADSYMKQGELNYQSISDYFSKEQRPSIPVIYYRIHGVEIYGFAFVYTPFTLQDIHFRIRIGNRQFIAERNTVRMSKVSGYFG